ncbi:hypothetical protein ACD591_14455 [Rufibacter glacialis]|uniref:Uncharacterized protein n=1 Tax=Rufibacter glacialis TaxID=1259555 RepID=A0A5M8QT80_9BACT|nr:hypothetical protein [Rufibacter glacialis]KAA6437836.1 hypothetical protein FOE74_04870 [Rufibacter glacialis]GGK55948.1 hypothetical protein GCM10011405_00010 [Rufibacter glacialis]
MIKLFILLFITLFGFEPDTPKVKTKEIRNYYLENGKKNLSAITKEEYNSNGDLEYYSIFKTSNSRLTEVFVLNSYDSLKRKVSVREYAIELRDTIWTGSKKIEYFPNHTVEKAYDGNGKLLSRQEKFFSDSTSLLIAKISFSLVPIEPWNTEWMESEKYYYDSLKRLARISRINTFGADSKELEYEYTDEATTICRQYSNNGKLEAVTTTLKTLRQKLELSKVFSDGDTLKAGTRTTYNKHGLIEFSHNYPDINKGFYAEYSYKYKK